MAKVYVSSTVADLEQERRAVLDWLRLARHQAVDSYLPGSETVAARGRVVRAGRDREDEPGGGVRASASG